MGHSLLTGRHARSCLKTAVTAALAVLAMSAHAQEDAYRPRSYSEYALTNVRSPTTSIRPFGDYYFFDPAQGNLGPILGTLVGGLRASTGLVGLAQPMSLYDTRPDALQNLPYIGLGYSHLWFKSQVTLNADLGLENGRGHGLFGNATQLDDVTNQLRWAPVMAVNVRYAF
jgi:hypothetical protein